MLFFFFLFLFLPLTSSLQSLRFASVFPLVEKFLPRHNTIFYLLHNKVPALTHPHHPPTPHIPFISSHTRSEQHPEHPNPSDSSRIF
jgi:hypothetical protein